MAATQNADGTEMPIPRPDRGLLNIMAARGADPVTMQNKIWGSPSAFRASSSDPASRERLGSWLTVSTLPASMGLLLRLMPGASEPRRATYTACRGDMQLAEL